MVADGSLDLAEFEIAVDDVFWVVSHLVDGIASIPAKRGYDAEGDVSKTPASKRYVMLPHI